MKLNNVSSKAIAIKLNTNSFDRKNITFSDLCTIFNDKIVNEDETKTKYITRKLKDIDDFENSINIIKEFIDIRLFEGNEDNQRDYVDELNAALKPNGLILKKFFEEYELVNLNDLTEPSTIDVKHTEIKKTIIKEIENAKYLIWINIAWFTDLDIMRSLYKKKKDGINVQIIVQKNSENLRHAKILNEHFETYWFEPFGKNLINIMHRKNCMIDFEKVIMGSYNYTKNAESHIEDVAIIEGIEQARIYASEFMKLKRIVLGI